MKFIATTVRQWEAKVRASMSAPVCAGCGGRSRLRVLVWTASHPRGLMALLASQKDERKV
jgi:hypothetical protein